MIFDLTQFTPTVSHTIFIGILTFAIPYLWNAHQKITSYRDEVVGEKIEDILSIEFFQKNVFYFNLYIQTVSVILIVAGLFLTVFVTPIVNLIINGVALLYFALLPQIFNKIRDKSTTELKDYITTKLATDLKVQKVFQEIWQKTDAEFEKQFKLRLESVFEIFVQKLNGLLIEDNPLVMKVYLNDFLVSIQQRSITNLIISKESLPSLYKLHFALWKQVRVRDTQDDDILKWGDYNQCKNLLGEILNKILENVLSETRYSTFSYFERLKEHVSEHTDDPKYLESFFQDFYSIFFENIHKSPEHYDIWEHYFPSEWKVTFTNMKDSNNIIPKITWVKFRNWFVDYQSKAEDGVFDAHVDDLARNLFPETDPSIWAKILIMALSSNDPREPMKSLIETPWNFGIGGRIHTYWGESEADENKANEQFRLEMEADLQASYELALALPYFSEAFEKSKLEQNLVELNKLKFGNDEKKELKRQRVIQIVEGLLKKQETPVA